MFPPLPPFRLTFLVPVQVWLTSNIVLPVDRVTISLHDIEDFLNNLLAYFSGTFCQYNSPRFPTINSVVIDPNSVSVRASISSKP